MALKIGLLLISYFIQVNGDFCSYGNFYDMLRYNAPPSYDNDYGNQYENQHTEEESGFAEISCSHVNFSNFHPQVHRFHPRQNGPKYVYLKIESLYNPSIPPSAFVNVPYQLIKLEMNSTLITQILPGAFNSLNYLEELYLPDNRLTRIPDGVFNSLINLTVLDLSRNSIQDITAHGFAGAVKLRTINLSHNALKTFNNDWLTRVANIQSLDLSFNELMSNFTITSNTLNYLNLSNNDIIKFAAALPQLTVLDLSKNKLSSFNMDYLNNKNMLYLDLSYNLFSDLKSESFHINNIAHLFLQNNNITSISNDFFAHLNIQSLNLSCNKLEQFQYGLFDSLHDLEELDISHNKISAFKRFTYHSLTSLRNLYLHDNELHNLDSKDLLVSLPQLQTVTLDGNNFTCEVLVEIFHNLKFGRVRSGHSFNSSNIHGIACSDSEDFDVDLTSPENSTNTGNLLLSKLYQFFNSGFTKSEMYKYFNEDFKNSNFFKYIEKLKDGGGFKNSSMHSYFNDDFRNSSFYKYLENMKTEMQSNNDYDQRVKKYFESDFKNTSFVKYLDNVNKYLNLVNKVFSNGSMSMNNYFNGGFKDSNFYKYLEAMKAPQFIVKYSGNGTEARAERLISTVSEKTNETVSAPIIIMLLLLVCIAISLGFLTYLVYIKLKKHDENEQMELIHA